MKYFSQSFSKVIANILLIALAAGAAYGQYPATGNKQRLGFQTTGDGLIYRGRLSDTTAIKPSNINNAFYLQDTINDKLYRYIKTNGGWQPVQGKVQRLGVGADGANGATLYLTGSDTHGAGDALVVVDGLSSLRLPGINNTVVGIVTVTTVQGGVTITGTGLAVVSETPGEDGEITVNVVIPSGYITSAMLGAGLIDSVTTISVTDATTQDTSYVIVNTLEALQLPWDGSAVLGYSSAGESIENAVYLNVNGKNILIQGGGAMSMSANDAGDILTITSATNVAISQATGAGAAYSIVDAISSLRLPWDGNAVLGVVETFTSNDVTLTINDTTVTFKVGVPDGDKGDITVSGENWQIDAGAVSWTELSQGVKDSINQKLENPVDSILFTTANENTAIEGELTYNNQSGTLHLGMAGGIEMPVGQGEAHLVRNVTGSTIAKGKVVYISGSTGQRPQISLADADAEGTSSVTFGITAEAIAPNDSGFVFTSGYIHGINTNALTEGEALWLDTVPGGFTHTKPVAPINAVLVGYVITKKPNGTIFVKIQNGYEIDELHNVVTAGKVMNSVLRYDTLTQLWKASSTAGIVAGDTTAMLSTYLKKADTLSLSNRINTKQNTLTNSAGLAAALNDETGTGVAVFNDAPSFNTSITVNGNGVISRAPAASAITHIAVFAADPLNTARSIATRTPTQLRGDIDAQSTLTNSAGLAAALSDEVGNGAAVFNTNATMKQTLIVDNDSTSSISFGGWLSLKFNNQNRWNIAVQTPFVNNDLYFNDVANSRTPLALSRTNGFVGINEVSPSRQLHVTGEARITDLTTDTPTRIVGADADGDLGAATIGAGLEIVSGELKQKILTASDSLDFGSLGAWSSELKTITVTNAALSDPVTLGIPNSSSASVNVVFTAYISAADTVTVKATNAGSTTVDPGKGLFKIIVHKY